MTIRKSSRPTASVAILNLRSRLFATPSVWRALSFKADTETASTPL